jgi:hypothetical protein
MQRDRRDGRGATRGLSLALVTLVAGWSHTVSAAELIPCPGGAERVPLSREGDMQSDIPLLKEQPWFDIRLRYADGRRATVAVEKGSSGERAFAATFARWGQ